GWPAGCCCVRVVCKRIWIALTELFHARGGAFLARPSLAFRAARVDKMPVGNGARAGHTRNGRLLRGEPHPKLIIQEGDVVGRLVDTDRQSAAYAVASLPVDGKIDRSARCGRCLEASDHLA